ncbi:MAG TPA: hypothetical protein VKE42_03265 [Candidatus Cybelea sp.]|nr:hypothetical protein [Candidatus Cybelea sp.]
MNIREQIEHAARLLILADVAEHFGKQSVVEDCHNKLLQIALRFAIDNDQSGAAVFFDEIIDRASRLIGNQARHRVLDSFVRHCLKPMKFLGADVGGTA